MIEFLLPFFNAENIKATLEFGTVLAGIIAGSWSGWRQRKDAQNRAGIIERQLLDTINPEELKKDEQRKEAERLYKVLKEASPAAERVISRLVSVSLLLGVLVFSGLFVFVFVFNWSVMSGAALILVMLIRPFRKLLWGFFRSMLYSEFGSNLIAILGVSPSAIVLTRQYLKGVAFIQEKEEYAMARRIDRELKKALSTEDR